MDRLAAERMFVKGVETGGFATAAARRAAIRQAREVDKEHVAQEAERLHAKEVEQEHEAKVRRERWPGREL
jgi:hypothetical protein